MQAMEKTPWYEQIFNEEYLQRYSPMLTPERTTAEVEGVCELLALSPGSRLLDLCCGHGRHTVPLARRGYRMTGLDLSECFLRHAQANAAEEGVEVQWVRSDMRRIPFEGCFDAVVNLFTAFGYLEDEAEDQKVLQGVVRALKPGGVFLMEIIHRDSLLRRFAESGVQRLEDGTLVLEERSFDLPTSRQEVKGTLIYPDGRRSGFSHSLRLYTAAELTAMFRSAGLAGVVVYGGLDGSRLTLESRRLVITGQKPVE